MKLRKFILTICLLLVAFASKGQDYKLKMFVKNGIARMQINDANDAKLVDSVLISCGFAKIDIYAGSINLKSKLNWTISSWENNSIELTKPLSAFNGSLDSETSLLLKVLKTSPEYAQSTRAFGFNEKNIFHIRTLNNGLTRFELQGFTESKDVFLSGSFVNWSTLKLPMEKSSTGWQIDIDLPFGVHTYKFIVDGNWITDPNNSQTEHDNYGHVNSVYVRPNHTFKLAGNERARKVLLAASFTDWDNHPAKMKKTLVGWELEVYLANGTYPYKFIVDGNWTTDPSNPDKRRDAEGNDNSFLSIGDPILFRLSEQEKSSHVVLTGSFNNWNEGELVMEKKRNAWELEYVLSPGNYEYKYIVDGQWYLPINCEITSGENEETNCVLVLEPNKTFRLDGFESASDVRISGSFNNWTNPGYSMKKVEGGWEIKLHLDPGKYPYQFVVDGQWTPDPKNPQFEINEYGGKNSIVWFGL